MYLFGGKTIIFKKTYYVAIIVTISILTLCTSSVRYKRETFSAPLGGRHYVGSRKRKTRRPVPKGQNQVLSGKVLRGMASYYGPGFHGKLTANGEKYNMNGKTAAHKTLPFNTRVKVTNLENGKSVIVRINDRGPYKKRRIIDLSVGAAKEIGLIQSGVAEVKIKILK